MPSRYSSVPKIVFKGKKSSPNLSACSFVRSEAESIIIRTLIIISISKILFLTSNIVKSVLNNELVLARKNYFVKML